MIATTGMFVVVPCQSALVQDVLSLTALRPNPRARYGGNGVENGVQNPQNVVAAHAFQDAGHEVTLGWGDDGNCANPIAPTFQIPLSSPLGLPEAIARHTFPLA